MTDEQNYLNPEKFERFLGCLPKIKSFHSDYSKYPLTPKQLMMAAKIEYGCALRVSELLTLKPSDFNLNNLILTLNHTKTGFKRCKCKGLNLQCPKCEGKGRVRKAQFTTIPPWLADELKPIIPQLPDKEIFPITRQSLWSTYKEAGKIADLEIFEQQDERSIEGVWTHLLRKPYAKWMIRAGAEEVLVKLKLRHAFTVTDRYTRPDINYLKRWEAEHSLTVEV